MNSSMGLGSLISRNARHWPERTAVVVGEQRLTHQEFFQRAQRLASATVSIGVKKGDRIAVLLPNCLELLEIYWAAALSGAVVVPLSPMLSGSGILNLLNDCEPVALFTCSEFADVIEEVRLDLPTSLKNRLLLINEKRDGYVDYGSLMTNGISELDVRIDQDDVYNIMYTSGTTGQPKGIVLTHAIRNYYSLMMSGAFRIGPESVVLQTGSLVFNGAFVTMLGCFYSAGTYILHSKFNVDDLIATIKREKVTHIMLVPSQITALLASENFNPMDLQSLQMILSLGAPLHNSSKALLQKYLPGRFQELYGLTEGFLTILDSNDATRKRGSVGCPPPFCEMKIVLSSGDMASTNEIGEIVGKSPILMTGYYKRPDLTSAAVVDGWLYTGDLGYVDADGFLFLVDRKKDMIDSGGVKIYPRDIEDIVAQHPAVLEAVVFGIPDPKWGEVPIAAVILKKAESVDASALKQWANDRVNARYQRISEVLIMEEFPRNAAGKTLKRTLRDPYWQAYQNKI